MALDPLLPAGRVVAAMAHRGKAPHGKTDWWLRLDPSEIPRPHVIFKTLRDPSVINEMCKRSVLNLAFPTLAMDIDSPGHQIIHVQVKIDLEINAPNGSLSYGMMWTLVKDEYARVIIITETRDGLEGAQRLVVDHGHILVLIVPPMLASGGVWVELEEANEKEGPEFEDAISTITEVEKFISNRLKTLDMVINL
ncbi:hypothetical protein CCACVL1_07333 [Corchorus capsularis]|uniref:Uncharacterized protein n=1 Tax=Corchorus capsularis TaxID=210143 RepID=A0A1R3J6W8_COCAP|nr:hypothetical protein CCACVL1_07333 [Corchorus capsularis]